MASHKRELEKDDDDHDDQRVSSSSSSMEVSKKRKHNSALADSSEAYSSPKNLYKSHVAAGKGDKQSHSKTAYQEKQLSFTLTLAPIDANDPLAGVERQLDDALLTYVREASGILMGWANPRFTRSAGRLCEESPFSLVGVTVDALVWRPRRGEVMTGQVKLMGPSHIGLLILGTFNASIPRSQIPPDWTYEENFQDDADGAWRAGGAATADAAAGAGRIAEGNLIALESQLAFTVINIKRGANILSVEGSLLHNQSDHGNQASKSEMDEPHATQQEELVLTKSEEGEGKEEEMMNEGSVLAETKHHHHHHDASESSKAERKARRKSEKKARKKQEA